MQGRGLEVGTLRAGKVHDTGLVQPSAAPSGRQDARLSFMRTSPRGHCVRGISSAIERDGSGRVTLVPEEDEDMHHLYNLIEPGDLVRAARRARLGRDEMMRMPHLARTFRDLSTLGKEAFYKGRIAREIASIVEASGGHMELDLGDHIQRGVDEVQPVACALHLSQRRQRKGWSYPVRTSNQRSRSRRSPRTRYPRRSPITQVPDLRTLEHNPPEYLHALIEALRLAFADARKFVSDPQHLHNGKPALDLEHVLSISYLESRAKLNDPNQASADSEAGSPFATSDTVYFTMADKDGNACSFINSDCHRL
ncbi:hypothetical protein A4X13_0g6115 [Tilletia indica]|uniref:Pelota N-terminal domain-containing protein n=1 Tax=Tilletia indica TaxID=43049 RepID=A0A8T8SPI3_9BASI|nr:hypothetical protein A4X13_0g6115 [Tilletia indica]